MENPYDATDFSGHTLDLWRRFLGIVADFPRETSPQPTDSTLSAADLIRYSQEAQNAVVQDGKAGPQAASRSPLEVPDAGSFESKVPPRAEPPRSSPPVAAGLELPSVSDAQRSVSTPPLPASERPVPAEPSVPAIAPRRSEVPPPRQHGRWEHDLVGRPSTDDPYGQDDRESGILRDQRRYDPFREVMVETYRQQSQLERDYRSEQLRMMRRVMDDLGSDFRQLLDTSASYEYTRDTLTDSPV